MGDNNYGYNDNKGFACCRIFSSPSMKLLFLIFPLMVVSGFITLLGPSIFHVWSWRYTGGGGLITSNPLNGTVKERGDGAGGRGVVEELHPSMAAATGADHHLEEEEKRLAVSDDSVVTYSYKYNRSAPPQEPAHVEASSIQEFNATQGNGNHISINGTPKAATSMNESLNPPIEDTMNPPMEFTSLGRLEAGLQKVRAAIKEAKTGNLTQDPDYVPMGPMYWNAKVFHRSYLEMEKQFKVFVYEEGELPVFHNGPCKSIYSMEGNFIHRMEIDGKFRTKDPEKAHVYFLPFSVAMMVQFVYVRNSHDFDPIRRTVRDYVSLIAGKYPYWNRSLGADHFMLACHDWGPEASFSVPYLGRNAIRVLCNANTSERFNPIKDVSFPEINLQTGSIRGFVGGPSPSKRSILAFFAGGLHGPIRPILLEHWENKDDDLKVHRYLPKGVSYYEMMRKSKFCLCPSGYEVASPRIVEAIYAGCVPVLISDHYVPPFSDVLNWKSFSVEVPVSDIPNLKRVLTSISPRQYIRMQRRVVQIRRHFEVNSPPKRFDVFHMILHSIWLRRLNVKIDHDHQFAIIS